MRPSAICLLLFTLVVLTASTFAWIAESDEEPRPSPAPQSYATSHYTPAGAPRVEVSRTEDGRAVTARCSTCHANRAPNHATRAAKDLDEFHQGLKFQHGRLGCFSCHSAANYDQLGLADGTAVEYSEVMRLCAQCHHKQMDEYEHGAHGGMQGYWDVSRGPRTKKSCIECHDPHAPQFPRMQPTFKPQDRFLNAPQSSGATHE